MDYQDSITVIKLPFHPFCKHFTASSFAHCLYRFFGLKNRTLFLTENPTNARKTSALEAEWLAWMAFKHNVHIRTNYNHEDGQVRAGRYCLDGFAEETWTAYEFQG